MVVQTKPEDEVSVEVGDKVRLVVPPLLTTEGFGAGLGITLIGHLVELMEGKPTMARFRADTDDGEFELCVNVDEIGKLALVT